MYNACYRVVDICSTQAPSQQLYMYIHVCPVGGLARGLSFTGQEREEGE